ncbi:SAM-dependent methyltransferase [Flavobacterium cupreum]|uniref:site-specific DNA-methyltransferase (adenine-specific) n=2 Tax=Flavobacterium TaxID=237 RepID=A0A434A3L7_9FLAO|nr:N-6 DNA methylase [Flavobacterium cupreum]RUT68981.1 SAM-dependent methyltransferase [Flavobacterium cupreum]
MATTLFKQKIHDLNFSFLDKEGKGGILMTFEYEKLDKSLASPDVLFALETAFHKFSADAVYFRHFEDGRALVPQLYIFDYTDKLLTNDDRNRIHISMWNGYQVPLYIIITKTSVAIFDAREKPNESRDSYAKEILTYTGEAIKSFNAQSFDDGLFWEEQDEKKHFKFEQSAARDLIRGLKHVYKSFQEKSGLNRHVALKLLVQSLLIKYLEERDEDSHSGYFAGTYFIKHFGSENFCAVIRNGKLLDLLDQLAKDFNGKIFEWDEENEKEEREAIQKSEVQALADYLDGNLRENQFLLWRLYSFSHLPVEVLSSVYEELLTDSKDIVYTPEMIVSTLVDECMPLKNPQSDFKMIDVSCGSGIFLVKTYKRIVQWWRYEQWKQTGELKKPPLSVLKELLLKSIYGIDIQQDAIRLSIFSLALAILDEVDLDPKTWGKLRFPDLSENIIVNDFFPFIVNAPVAEFDLVIGNPPFNLQHVDGKEPNRKKYFKELKTSIGYQSSINIPDENPALHFLVQSMRLLKPDALLCLVQPSGPILYQKDTLFKNLLFSKYNLLQVLDFTKLSDKLWGRKNVATAAVFLQNSLPTQDSVAHIVAGRTFSNTNRIFLEFDHYDFHMVTKSSAISSPYIWKSNLLGGGRIVQLIEKISVLRTLGEFLDEKKSSGWVKGEGFIEKGDKNKADYLTGKKFLPTELFTENGIESDDLPLCNIEYFHRPRKEELYTAPHLLIRKILGKTKLITEYKDEYLSFLSDIFSIHAPESDKDELIKISDYLKNNGPLLRFYILATSSRVKVNKSTSLYDEDLLHIPYPENISDIKLSTAEKIVLDDSIKHSFVADSQNQINKRATVPNIVSFSEVFCKTLNSVYDTDGKTFQLFKTLDAGDYWALHFEYTSNQITSISEYTTDLEQYINAIIPSHNGIRKSYHVQKIIKIYGKDCIILAKPKQLRYWLQSTALNDADECFADYFKARYQNA